MTVFCLGSINADHFYEVPHLPAPGETLAANAHCIGLGGKGANQSVAVAKAGSKAVHIGAVGADGAWATERLEELGVDTRHIATVDSPTAHAIINVAEDGENAIVIFSRANLEQSEVAIRNALSEAQPGDRLILQNETSMQLEAARIAREFGLQVVYSAAPFSEKAVREVLPYVDLLAVNDVEAAQLESALGTSVADLPVSGIVVTKGADGADYLSAGKVIHADALPVDPKDTTGAGDTFIGYFVAGLDQGLSPQDALKLAAAAGALKVTRPGTADAIPSREEVDAFRA
ncbi:MAG: ribokinase [Pseudomonadota bacterium]